MATPGVGHKKIMGFFDLLKRASKASSPDAPFGMASQETRRQKTTPTGCGFDAAIVSESLWSQWCETVHRYGLGPEKLGRLAPTLQSLPTVIWHSRTSRNAFEISRAAEGAVSEPFSSRQLLPIASSVE